MTMLAKTKYTGAMLGASIGDALGWPNEQNSRNINHKKNSYNKNFVSWRRKSGGRFWPHEEKIAAGEYSDDTQLLIATLRSLLKGSKWSTFFMQSELPTWLVYERGGGGATKRAAECWKKGNHPWDEKTNSYNDVKRYFMAGGNGVAMRIMPHVFCNENDISMIMKQVVLNGMYTHGHPRALLGGMLYAYGIQYILTKESTLGYGELIQDMIDNKVYWSSIPSVNNFDNWILCAERVLHEDYRELWNSIVHETLELLEVAKRGIDLGVLDIGNETLTKLGCFNKECNGAGNNTAVICIYLFSKYADDPVRGLVEAANLRNADTDTIASMVGGLFGALYGVDWIPLEWRMVQDYNMFDKLIDLLISGRDCISLHDKKLPLFGKDTVFKMNKGDSLILLPFGKVTLCEIENEYNSYKNIKVLIRVLKTEYEQTIYVKKLEKIKDNSYKNEEVSDKIALKQQDANKAEKKIMLSSNELIKIHHELKKVTKTEDFINILNEMVIEMQEHNFELNKEFITALKDKWNKYKITKKALNSVADILRANI
nr:ADP-ribosylglycohydrolase family protein [uncultured Lachnoclostridium sp.]